MSLKYDVIFQSGQTDQFKYETYSNVSDINITKSDQSYYQSTTLTLYDISQDDEDSLDINNTLKIYIDDDIIFDGYVNRVKRSIAGKRKYTIQAIGRTYDLWRFTTSSTTSFTNKYTSYIVSSLVSDYCSGNGYVVYPPKIGPASGSFIDYVELFDMEIGSCVGRMAQFDGYSFFVDEDGILNYYEPKETEQFTVTESDIIKMSEIDESDDSMKNDILVLGSVQYEKFSEKLSAPDGYIYISGTATDGGDGRYIAQKITVPDDLHADKISSIKLYIDRSIGDNTPYYLKGSITKDNDGEPSSNVELYPGICFYASSDSLKFIGTDVIAPPDWTSYYTYSSPESFPISGGQAIWLVFNYDGASSDKWWKLGYGEFNTIEYGAPNNEIDFDPNFTETFKWPSTGASAERYEYYDSGDDAYVETAIYSQHYCQTFTVGTVGDCDTFIFSGVAIKGYLVKCDGDEEITFSLTTLDEDGKPDTILSQQSAVVGKGDQPGDFPSSLSNVDWYYIGFEDRIKLDGGSSYAIKVSGNWSVAAGEQLYWAVDSSSPSYAGGTCRLYVTLPPNIWTDTGYDAMFKISGLQVGHKYGDVGYDDGDQHIYFHVSSIGYAELYEFSNEGSRRYRDFGISSGGVTSDLPYFVISANINSYWSGNQDTSFPKYEEYGKYNSRLMIGIFDPTSPNGLDYNPMIGLEFDLQNYYQYETYYYDYVTDDVRVFGEYPDSTYGGTYYTVIGTSAFDKISRTLIKFDLSELPSDIEIIYAYVSMKVIICGPGADDQPIDIHRNTESWDESTVTWNNAPAYDATPTTLIYGAESTIDPTTRWTTFDVTEDVRDFVNGIETNYGWTFKAETEPGDMNSYNVYNTKEASTDKPRFNVCYRKWRRVKPFLSTDITDSSPSLPQYRAGDWEVTGAKSYKCQILGTNFLFYIDGVLEQTWDISNITLDGNYKFGDGNVYNWSGFRIQLIDTTSGNTGEVFNFAGISGNINYIEVGTATDHLSVSDDSGQTWTNHEDKHLIYSVGWNYDNVRGTATDDDSIATYGKHFYKVSEELLTTHVDCENYAQRLLETYSGTASVGNLTINGNPDINIRSKFRLSGSNLNVDENLIIAQYTHSINKDGFTSEISYGEAPYDIARKIANLEGTVY